MHVKDDDEKRHHDIEHVPFCRSNIGSYEGNGAVLLDVDLAYFSYALVKMTIGSHSCNERTASEKSADDRNLRRDTALEFTAA